METYYTEAVCTIKVELDNKRTVKFSLLGFTLAELSVYKHQVKCALYFDEIQGIRLTEPKILIKNTSTAGVEVGTSIKNFLENSK